MAVQTQRPYFFRIAPFLAVWQRMSGLLLRVRLSFCKILHAIRFPSASFGRFLIPGIDEGCVCSFSLSSGFLLLDGGPLVFRFAMPSSLVCSFLNREEGDFQDVVPLFVQSSFVSEAIRRVPQLQYTIPSIT